MQLNATIKRILSQIGTILQTLYIYFCILYVYNVYYMHSMYVSSLNYP